MATTTKTTKKQKVEPQATAPDIEITALHYQQIAREIKRLESEMKPLKEDLIIYAKKNKINFDDDFQLKFTSGTYVSLRVKDSIIGSEENKTKFMEATGDKYAITKLNEKALFDDCINDAGMRKAVTKFGLDVEQKETFAVYAG